MFCALSGHVPQRPVISRKSGHLYEARLVERYIEENGQEPATGEPLTLEDLVEVKSAPKQPRPRPAVLASVPSLLHTLQSEYDATMLECATLRTQVTTLRQELSNALYQNDAAYRVIARLVKERDSAREALAGIDAQLGRRTNGNGAMDKVDDAMQVESGLADGRAMPSAIAKQIEDKSAELSALRRRRKVPPGWTTPEEVKGFVERQVIPSLHATRPAGITALAVSSTGEILLTGGNDKTVQLFDRVQEKVMASLKGHQKKINDVLYLEHEGVTRIVSASADKSVKIWQEESPGGGTWHARDVTGLSAAAETTALALHPTGSLVLCASADGWSMVDLASGGAVLAAVSHADDPRGLAAIQVHPDGNILAAGTAETGIIRIWDIRQSSVLATFEGHQGSISALAFSENGYLLASSGGNGSEIKIWDLRKLTTVATLSDGPTVCRAMAFDASGQFLAATGDGSTVIWQCKVWTELVRFAEKAARLGLAWHQGLEVMTAGSDRSVRVYGVAGGGEGGKEP